MPSKVSSYDLLRDPPRDRPLFDFIERSVLSPTYKGLHTTLSTYRGSGLYSTLTYLLKHHQLLRGFPSNRIYLFLDIPLFLENSSNALHTLLENVVLYFADIVNEHPNIKNPITRLIQQQDVSFVDFMMFVNTILSYDDLHITLVMDHVEAIYSSLDTSVTFADALHALYKYNMPKLSLLYINYGEFNDSTVRLFLNHLSKYFYTNIVTSSKIIFGKSAMNYLIKEHNSMFKDNFINPTVVSKLETYLVGFPAILRRFMLFGTKDALWDDFLKAPSYTKAIKLLGEDFYEKTFYKTVRLLHFQTLRFLLGKEKEPATSFVFDTGLVDNQGVPRNKLLKHYIDTHSDKLLSDLLKFEKLRHDCFILNFKRLLTPKELILFNVLYENSPSIVPRDKISHALWGDTWELDFSLWAFDKIVSNLRKKLEKYNFPMVLKVAKNIGLQLV